MKRISILIFSICLLFTLTSCKVKNLTKEDFVDKYYHYHVLEEKETGAIDLRDLHSEYAMGHLKGFVNYNFQNGNKEEFIYYVSSLYNKNFHIFLIASNKEDIQEASTFLKEEGYKHIYIYEEDFDTLLEYAKDYIQIIEGIDDCGC